MAAAAMTTEAELRALEAELAWVQRGLDAIEQKSPAQATKGSDDESIADGLTPTGERAAGGAGAASTGAQDRAASVG
jgi:hypothetical protein